MKRAEYVAFMQRNGFQVEEAEKMADFAGDDFDSYEEAVSFYSGDEKFLRGRVYAGHRKARRLFRKKEGCGERV